MLEDLFKMVKDRFNEEQKDVADSSAPEIPKDLLFKCPRCQNVFYMDEFEKRKKTCPVPSNNGLPSGVISGAST